MVTAQTTEIITSKEDSLSGIKIKKNTNFTNQDQATYSNGGDWQTLNASEISSYWDGNAYFKSYQVGDSKKLLSLMLNGVLSLSYGIEVIGSKEFFIKFENQDQYISLSTQSSDIESFLRTKMNDYESFKNQYGKNVIYTQKSLGEFVSAYNEWREPSKYTFSKFKHENVKTFSISLDALLGKTKLGDFEMSNSIQPRLSVFFEKYLIGPNIGFGSKVGFQRFAGHVDESSYVLNSAGLDGYLLFKIYESSGYDINITPGLSFDVNYSGKQKIRGQFNQSVVSTLPADLISLGYFVAITVDSKGETPLRYFFEYGSNQVGFRGSTVLSYQSIDGNIKQFAFGIGVRL